jgi:S-formylglutathione hydrolase FrmB
LSEKDALNVLAVMRKEFKIDDNRTYLMGHSMGGAGTLFLGSEHPKEFAAIGAMAPAAFLTSNDRGTILQKIKDSHLPGDRHPGGRRPAGDERADADRDDEGTRSSRNTRK